MFETKTKLSQAAKISVRLSDDAYCSIGKITIDADRAQNLWDA